MSTVPTIDLASLPELDDLTVTLGGTSEPWASAFLRLDTATRGQREGAGARLASRLFFEGGAYPPPKPGVGDATYATALRFAVSTLRSLAIEHNAKIRVVGALFEAVGVVVEAE